MAYLELPQGIPATILLILTTIVGGVVSIKTSDHHTGIFDDDGIWWFLTRCPTKIRSSLTACVALSLWIWALNSAINKGPLGAFGVVSFFSVIISSLIHVYYAENEDYREKTASVSFICLIIVSLEHCFMLFSGIISSWGLNLYLIVGTIYWALLAFWNWKGYVNETIFFSRRKSMLALSIDENVRLNSGASISRSFGSA